MPENLTRSLLFGKPDSSQLLFMDGTSQATPAVTGCVAVLRSAFRHQQNTTPTGAMLKALIVHGSVDLVGTPFTLVTSTGPGKSTRRQLTMTQAPNPFQGYGLVDINNSLLPIIGSVSAQKGFVDGSRTSGKHMIYALTIPNSAASLTITLAYTDLPGEALGNEITLSAKLADGSTLIPLAPTDPAGRSINWKPSNVAKIRALSPLAGQAEIFLTVRTSEPVASFAVVWTIV